MFFGVKWASTGTVEGYLTLSLFTLLTLTQMTEFITSYSKLVAIGSYEINNSL